MEMTNRLNYGDKINYYEGVVVDVKDGNVFIDILGRLGWFEIPVEMVNAEHPLKRGQSIGWKMSFLEQLASASDEYVSGVQNPDGTTYYEAIVTDVDDCAVQVELKENQGKFKTPMRMLISDIPFKPGQAIGWNMTKLVQLGPEVNEKYVSNIQNRERRAKEISSINK